MGRIEYQVLIKPNSISPLAQERDNITKSLMDVENVVDDILSEWTCIRVDKKVKASKPQEIPLVYETNEELFQILTTTSFQLEEIYFSLRFAYYNPASIYSPFCQFIVWLMKRYSMYCSPMRPLISTDGIAIIKPYPIGDVHLIESVLIPSMEYMHNRWREFAGNEEVKLRPEEAILYLRHNYHPQDTNPDASPL